MVGDAVDGGAGREFADADGAADKTCGGGSGEGFRASTQPALTRATAAKTQPKRRIHPLDDRCGSRQDRRSAKIRT